MHRHSAALVVRHGQRSFPRPRSLRLPARVGKLGPRSCLLLREARSRNEPLQPVNARDERGSEMRNRKQQGQIMRIGERWYVRYWERRNIAGTVERKRVTHLLGEASARGKRPPADINTEAERHMATVNSGTVPAERIVTIGDFVERVYLPWIKEHKRPSTAKGYRDIWEDHLEPLAGAVWLKDARTYHVQGWLNQIGAGKLSRNTLKHVKSVVSAIFTLAKQQDYVQG